MRKYKCVVSLTAMLACLLTGCNQADKTEEKGKFTLEVTSSVSAEDCYICGDGHDTTIPYYGQRDSVGIIYWNEPAIADTMVRAYGPDGTEQFHTGVMMTGGIVSEEHGSAAIYAVPDNGRSEITIQYHENDKIDFESVRSILCQDCLNKVVDFYVNVINHGEENTIGTTGFCLVDFQTKEIYPLSGPTVGYEIRNYFVRFFTNETIDEGNRVTKDGTVNLLIFYAPTREP